MKTQSLSVIALASALALAACADRNNSSPPAPAASGKTSTTITKTTVAKPGVVADKWTPTPDPTVHKIQVAGNDLKCTPQFEERLPLLRHRFNLAVVETKAALVKMQAAKDGLTSRWSSGSTATEATALATAYEGLSGVTLEIKNTFGNPFGCDAGNGVKHSSEEFFPVYQGLREQVGQLRGTHTLGPQI